MMNTLQKLYKQAYSHNHNKCGIIDKAFQIEDWVKLVFGKARLFCLEHKLPTLEMWDELEREFSIEKYDIYVNKGAINIRPQNKVLIIGNTDAIIVCDRLKAYNVILMHGARVTIQATNHAVVFIENDGTGTIKEELSEGAILQYL